MILHTLIVCGKQFALSKDNVSTQSPYWLKNESRRFSLDVLGWKIYRNVKTNISEKVKSADLISVYVNKLLTLTE